MISSPGIGSGLDVQSLVTQLVAAERSPAENRLVRSETRTQTTLSALGSLKAALASLDDAASALADAGDAFGKLKTTSSLPEVFTASTTSGAVAGSFSIQVDALATVSKITTDPYVDSSSVVGEGTVTITVGSDSFDIELGSTDNTLADLRTKINDASDNTGVTATLLNESGGTRLILTASDTGTDNAVSLTSSATSDSNPFITTSVLQTAVNASVEIDGFTFSSSSNTISDAITGVSINLLDADPGNVGTLNLSSDTGAAESGVKKFVDAYNGVIEVMRNFASYNAETQSGGPLMGNITARSVVTELRNLISTNYDSSETFNALSQLGVSTQLDGTLEFDSSDFQSALEDDAQAVQRLFTADDGFGKTMEATLERMLGEDGRLEASTTSLESRLTSIRGQWEQLDVRMQRVEQRYLLQFTALDVLLAQMQTSSSYLSQQLENLPRPNSIRS